MRVAVLGAAGTIAPAIVRDLAESEEIDWILLLDLDPDRAAEVADEQGGGKAAARAADARSGLADELDGVDVLVNSASYRINLDAMGACLVAGCNYLDLGGLYHMTSRQLQLSDEFREREKVAILGIGSSPGKTNLMAARLAEELGMLDVCHVSAAGRDLDPPPGFSIPYALPTLIDELTLAPVVLREGEPVELEALASGGTVDFGEPIGPAPTIHTLHSELLTFGESFGCRAASFRLSLADELLVRLRELAGATEQAKEAAGRDAGRPSPRTVSVHLVEVRHGESEARMRAVTRPHDEWGMGGGIVSTAAPAAAAVRLLARGAIRAHGALPPEACIEPEAMFAELRTRGCEFEMELSQEAAA